MKKKKTSPKKNSINRSERYRITINSLSINKLLKPLPPTVRSTMIQVALSHWIISQSGKATIQLMSDKALSPKKKTPAKSRAEDMRQMLHDAAGDF